MGLYIGLIVGWVVGSITWALPVGCFPPAHGAGDQAEEGVPAFHQVRILQRGEDAD